MARRASTVRHRAVLRGGATLRARDAGLLGGFDQSKVDIVHELLDALEEGGGADDVPIKTARCIQASERQAVQHDDLDEVCILVGTLIPFDFEMTRAGVCAFWRLVSGNGGPAWRTARFEEGSLSLPVL